MIPSAYQSSSIADKGDPRSSYVLGNPCVERVPQEDLERNLFHYLYHFSFHYSVSSCMEFTLQGANFQNEKKNNQHY